jgi:hypothetical protein
VTTGRRGVKGCGFHFYFAGTRTLPDVIRNPQNGLKGFESNGVKGDIKCHGHVVAEGGSHKSGAVYRGNGIQPAPLPDWLRDYEEPSRKKKREFLAAIDKPQGDGSLIPKGGRYRFLLQEAGHLRSRGLGEQAIYLALQDLARRFCWDGENYAVRKDYDIRALAQKIAAKPCGRVVRQPAGLVISVPRTKQQQLTASLRELFPAGEAADIATVVARMSDAYPWLSIMTLRRAMKAAGFVKAGKSPDDGGSSCGQGPKFGDIRPDKERKEQQ